MINIDELTIGQVKELAKFIPSRGSCGIAGPARLAKEGQKVIAVLQRGWAFVGTYHQTGDSATLTDAACIRRWGTSEGLGELAEKGPLSDDAQNGPTVLDKCPLISFHIREAVLIMEANADAWRK